MLSGFSGSPSYFMTMNLGGSSVPWATPANAPIPSDSMSPRSSTVSDISQSEATSRAISAIRVGVM